MAQNSPILFFLEGRNVPAARFRVEQYEGLLRGGQVSCRRLYTRPSKYLYCPRWAARLHLGIPWAVLCLSFIVATRLFQILVYAGHCRVVFLQRDLLYRVPFPFLERLLFRRLKRRRLAGQCRIVFDVDDAIFLDKGGCAAPRQRRKIEYIARNSDQVIAGNEYLEKFFAPLAPTAVVPTVIDSSRYRPKDWAGFLSGGRPLVVGWTGSAGNLRYLSALEPVLVQLQNKYEFELLIITNSGARSPFGPALRNVEILAWSPRTEIEDLHKIDVGLMPLPDEEWARGKCGFKLLQYMAAGLPVIASPVGVNSRIVTNGVNGFLASGDAEWAEAFQKLFSDRALAIELGKNGRETVVAAYDISRWFPKWLSLIEGVGQA